MADGLDIMVITGLSGSGKSFAIRAFVTDRNVTQGFSITPSSTIDDASRFEPAERPAK